MILHTSLQWLRQKIQKSFNPHKTPNTSSYRVNYGVSSVRILEKTDRVIMASDCISRWNCRTYVAVGSYKGFCVQWLWHRFVDLDKTVVCSFLHIHTIVSVPKYIGHGGTQVADGIVDLPQGIYFEFVLPNFNSC